MAVVLRIDHDGDLTNRYVQVFREKHIFRNFARDHSSHSLHTAINADANEGFVTALLTQHQVDFVSGAGHGAYESFTGQGGKSIWTAGQNLNLLSGKFIHLLSCQTGAVLGRTAVREGAKAFWGYNVSFVFKHQDNVTSLEQDSLAELFLKMDIAIDRGILARRNASDIYDAITRYVAQCLANLTTIDRGLLLSNYVHLACPVVNWGNKAATL